jgi:hypothetical protein
MNKSKILNSKVAVAGVVVIAVGGGLFYAQRKAAQTVDDIGQAINPVNQDNIFASGVNAVGAKLSGNKYWSLGSWIYDITHNNGVNNE